MLQRSRKVCAAKSDSGIRKLRAVWTQARGFQAWGLCPGGLGSLFGRSSNGRSLVSHGTHMSLIPWRIRNYCNKLYQGWMFPRVFRRFLSTIQAGKVPDPSVYSQLVVAWGNVSFSADTRYLQFCVSQVQAGSGPILECGSGLSTLVVAAVASVRGRELYSLEHHAGWREKVQRELDRFGLNTVAHLPSTPLVSHGDFDWYDVAQANIPAGLTLVICDAPPHSTRGGRSGLMPVMRKSLSPGCRVLMDDGIRQGEKEIVRKWQADFGGTVTEDMTGKGILVYQVPEGVSGLKPVG